MFIVTGSTSTSTGVAPASATTFAVAGNVYAGTSTSSPGPMPSASTATWSAAVPGRDGDRVLGAGGVGEQRLELGDLRRPSSAGPDSSTSRISASSASPTSGDARRTMRQCRFAGAIPRDRPLEAVVELDLRVEADVLARLLDVRDAQLDVDVLERREHDLARAAGEALDALREVEDRHRASAGCRR